MTNRPEPLLAERLWAHPSLLASFETTFTTETDEAGRLTRVIYEKSDEGPREAGEERYTYDEQGRLVAIDEYAELWRTVDANVNRYETGGRIDVEHDDRGPLRLTGPQGVVWERRDEPWPDLLRRGATAIADSCVSSLRAAGMDPASEVFALLLRYFDDHCLSVFLVVGMEAERREIIRRESGEEIARFLWRPTSAGLGDLEPDVDTELNLLLVREAALNSVWGEYRVVLTEVARLLAAQDWTGIFTPTDDFVVFIAEHDEDYAPKDASVRDVNPPERVAAWDAKWPKEAPRR